ncbi:hypothetical protein TorRG33x02_156620, partial [Trema orientale]
VQMLHMGPRDNARVHQDGFLLLSTSRQHLLAGTVPKAESMGFQPMLCVRACGMNAVCYGRAQLASSV